MSLLGEVDEQGRLILPADVVHRYGYKPGSVVVLRTDSNQVHIMRSPSQLGRVYLELTNRCNLQCQMCIRRTWSEPTGFMDEALFSRLIEDLKQADPMPSVCLSGLGEPLFHPRVTDWVARLKALGASVELITNATLLTPARSKALIEAGLDILWVSLDAATGDQYAAVRQGADLELVKANLEQFLRLRPPRHRPKPEVGIVFVAMKSNIQELPGVLQLGRKLGAVHFIISNVYPYSEAMQEEMLYLQAPKQITYFESPWLPKLRLPKMDFLTTPQTHTALDVALNGLWNLEISGLNLSQTCDHCRFVESGSVVIGWDGCLSPCIVLLRSHTTYLHGKPRHVRAYTVGNLRESSLWELWEDPAFYAFRQRVQQFTFSPCTFCGGCDLSESNETDCLQNPYPTCGGCFWGRD